MMWSFPPCSPLASILQTSRYSWSELKTQDTLLFFLIASLPFPEMRWSEEQGFLRWPGFNLRKLPTSVQLMPLAILGLVVTQFCDSYKESSILVSVRLDVCDPTCFSLLLPSWNLLIIHLFIYYLFIDSANMCQALFLVLMEWHSNGAGGETQTISPLWFIIYIISNMNSVSGGDKRGGKVKHQVPEVGFTRSPN